MSANQLQRQTNLAPEPPDLTFEHIGDAKLVSDFRRVLDDKNVHAVVIATPHHWHCPIALRALAAGKDVYVEKPASHVFQEGRLLVDAAARDARIVQHGTQMRSSPVTVCSSNPPFSTT